VAPPKKKNALSSLRWLVLMAVPAGWCGLSTFDLTNGRIVATQFGALDFFENRMTDYRFRARGERDAPVKLIYVDIDTDAIQQYKWPWNPSRYAQLIDALFDLGKVKAVGFDLVFSDKSRADFGLKEQNEGRLLFGKAINKHRNVVLAANYVPGPGTLKEVLQFPFVFDGATDPAKNDVPEAPGYPIIGPSWGTIGLIDTYEGEARMAPFFADTPVATFYPLSLQLALLNWGVGTEAIQRFPDHMEVRRPDGTLLTSIPLRRNQLVEANWFSHWISPKNPRFSVADIGDYLAQLESPDPEKQARGREFFAQFNDAIILVGPVDNLLQDLARTAFDDVPVPQVGFHGNLLKTLTSGLFIRHMPRWLDYALIFALTLAVSSLAAAGGRRGLGYKLGAGLLIVGYIALDFYVFSSFQLVLPLIAPLGAVFTTSFAAIGWQLIEEEKQKGRIKGMFGTYVSPQLVDSMMESGEEPRLGGHVAEITPYFSDIQAFSAFSEKLPPEKLVELMNEYLTACTDIVLAQGGALDKYIGDAVVAMFGGLVPLQDHALRACVASQLVQRKLGELREKWRAEGDKWPEIVVQMQTRIGLNSGLVTVGNMGSHARFNYTMMGDNVNLTARMESGAKAYGVYTMVTEATKAGCEQHGSDRVVFRYLDKIVVKGRTIPVPIYEIVGLKEDVSAPTRECLGLFDQGIARYLVQDWDAGEALFRRSAELEPNQPGKTPGVESNPSLALIERCRYMRAHPPGKDWDGVYVMKEK
jgi:adenylate cyclase